MATATTTPRRRSAPPAARKSGAGSRPRKAAGPAKTKAAGPAKTVKRATKTAREVRTVQRALPGKAGSLMTMWRLARLGRRLVKRQLPAAAESLRAVGDALRPVTELGREHRLQELAMELRRVPVQLSIDLAVPLEVAYDQWMELDSLPEGDHRVDDIERDGRGRLLGSVSRVGGAVHDWEAEVRDERRDESFAWRSTRGSDVAGLVTFHRLGERLTRLELQLDIVPTTVSEALALALHLSDHVAEGELRRFKSSVETISPDTYPARARHADGRASKRDKSKQPNRGAAQRKARARKSRNQSKEE